ncbi:MAG TPA: branched-chain amino acid ABC transporter permease [Ktedonobacteraceae bacterium]|nr:branched-chain amino acid ABC transporter permease [Ktedonobacteraceae bacterium]
MRFIKIGGLLALVAFGLAFPFLFPNQELTSISIYTLLFAAAATAWNFFSGYTGYISLGHGAFYGIGAYTMALGCKYWHIPGGYIPFLLVPLAGILAGLAAFPLGWIALKTNRQVFVLVTLALLYITQVCAYNFSFTQGSGGIYLPVADWDPDFFNLPFYYTAFALVVIAVGIAWWMRRSKFGLGLLAIRDDEERALSLGIKTEWLKQAAYVLSAIVVGMVGAVSIYYVAAINPPTAFAPVFDVTIALMTILGGAGTIFGPLLGAVIMEPLQQYITLQYGDIIGLDLVIFGVLLLAIILLLPEGIIPTVQRLWYFWRSSRKNKNKADLVRLPEETDGTSFASFASQRRATGLQESEQGQTPST